MIEQEYLKKCLSEIEGKLQWGASHNWTNREFTELSILVSEKSGISISTSSLRRLFGRSTDYQKPYNPQLETKNALAKFLDYNSWHEYKQKKIPESNKSAITKKRVLTIAIIFGVSILVAIILFYNINIVSKNPFFLKGDFNFSGKDLVSNELPHTILVKYNVSELEKPLYIDWDDVSPDATGGSDYEIITSDSGSFTHTYFFKDKYDIRLLDKNHNTVSTLQAIMYSNSWECYVYQGETKLLTDSLYFICDSVMYADNAYLANKGIDFTKPYRVIYRNLSQFSADANNYTFSVDFLPEFRQGYIECGHVQIEVIGSGGGNLITLMQNGCTGQLGAIYLNKVILSGKKTDLSAFAVSDRVWQNLKLHVRNDSTFISLRDQNILSIDSPSSIENILGIRIEFLGNGMVKNISLQ